MRANISLFVYHFCTMSVFLIDTISTWVWCRVWIILTRNYLLDNILEKLMTQKHTHSSWEPEDSLSCSKEQAMRAYILTILGRNIPKIIFWSKLHCRHIVSNLMKIQSVISEIKNACRHNTVFSLSLYFVLILFILRRHWIAILFQNKFEYCHSVNSAVSQIKCLKFILCSFRSCAFP